MEQLVQFIEDYWVLLAVILVTVIAISVIIRSIISLIIIGLVIGGILIYGFNYTPEEVKQMGEKVVKETILPIVKNEIIPLVEKELEGADFIKKEDGTYELKTTHITIVGQKGSDTVVIHYKGQQYTVTLKDLGEKIEKVLQETNALQEIK